MSLIVVILLAVLIIGAWPGWGYSRGWGYYPSGALGLVLFVVLILVLFDVWPLGARRW